MEPEVSLLHSQAPASGSNPDEAQSSLCLPIRFVAYPF